MKKYTRIALISGAAAAMIVPATASVAVHCGENDGPGNSNGAGNSNFAVHAQGSSHDEGVHQGWSGCEDSNSDNENTNRPDRS